MSISKRIGLELATVAVIASMALSFRINEAGMASGSVDSLLHAGAQDEAVYGHAAARMARTGHWLTPIFLDRFMLNKPPLLMWAGAVSMRLAGIDPVTLRLPVLGAGVLCCVFVYLWVRRSRSIAAALVGVALLLAGPVFFSISRKFMTDTLLTLFVTAAMFVIATDLRWERRRTALWFGVLSGAAIMTKSAAGLVPLLILAVYWAMAGAKERPPLRRVLEAVAVAAIVAAPWHVDQFVVHRDWFMAEYVRFQLLGSGVTAPSRYTGDSNVWFYVKTLLRTDPILVVLWVISIPGMVIAWRRNREARLLTAWLLTVAACLLLFGTRAAYYLMPLLPALALTVSEFLFWPRGWRAWAPVAALVFLFLVRADYRPQRVAAAPALDNYVRLRRTNELLIAGIDDEFYSSVLDLPKVRYVYLTPLDATKTSEFFYRLGMILPRDQFCSLAQWMPVYEKRLRDWKLPPDLHPEATLIDAGSASALSGLIQCSPDRDFLIPEGLVAADEDHVVMPAAGGMAFLLAKKSSQRDPDSIAPGTVVRDPRR